MLCCESLKITKNAAETVRKFLMFYGQDVITDRQVRNWFSEFHTGDISLTVEPKPCHPSDLDEDSFRELIE